MKKIAIMTQFIQGKLAMVYSKHTHRWLSLFKGSWQWCIQSTRRDGCHGAVYN